MAINFNKNSVFDLKPMPVENVQQEVNGFLLPGEDILCAFKTVRDQLLFTTKRIISIDVQGITGKRKSFTTMPYSKIQFFAVQTPGFLELVPDSELAIMFSNGFTANFEIKGSADIGQIARILSEYVL